MTEKELERVKVKAKNTEFIKLMRNFSTRLSAIIETTEPKINDSEIRKRLIEGFWAKYIRQLSFQANMDIIKVINDKKLTIDEKCIVVGLIREMFEFKFLMLEVRIK